MAGNTLNGTVGRSVKRGRHGRLVAGGSIVYRCSVLAGVLRPGPSHFGEMACAGSVLHKLGVGGGMSRGDVGRAVLFNAHSSN